MYGNVLRVATCDATFSEYHGALSTTVQGRL
jgi:hypothetical protein